MKDMGVTSTSLLLIVAISVIAIATIWNIIIPWICRYFIRLDVKVTVVIYSDGEGVIAVENTGLGVSIASVELVNLKIGNLEMTAVAISWHRDFDLLKPGESISGSIEVPKVAPTTAYSGHVKVVWENDQVRVVLFSGFVTSRN